MTVDVRDQAERNLRFIRGAMERAGQLSAVSGAGAMAMGGIALLAMALAATMESPASRLLVWIASAFVATAAGATGCWMKAKRQRQSLFGDPGRRFLLCLTPALLVGVVVTHALLTTPQMSLLPGIWMMLYGAGVLAAGTYAVAPVMQMGGVFLMAGLLTLALPSQWANVLLGAAFGGLHLYFGLQVVRHHGG